MIEIVREGSLRLQTRTNYRWRIYLYHCYNITGIEKFFFYPLSDILLTGLYNVGPFEILVMISHSYFIASLYVELFVPLLNLGSYSCDLENSPGYEWHCCSRETELVLGGLVRPVQVRFWLAGSEGITARLSVLPNVRFLLTPERPQSLPSVAGETRRPAIADPVRAKFRDLAVKVCKRKVPVTSEEVPVRPRGR